MADGSIVIETDLDTTEIEKDLKGLKKDIKESAEESAKAMEKSSERTSKSTKKSSEETRQHYKKTEEQAKQSAANAEKYWTGAADKIKNVISIAAKTTATALAAGAVASVKVGSSFESAMSEVKAISGAAGTDFEKLTEKAKEMGATTKFSATESAEALKYMAMAGWETEQMTDGLAGVMNLAAASGENLGTVSDIVTDAMTAFGLEAKESTHFADVLAKASSSSNTNVGLMGETFKYVAPIAGSMKYSIEDTATAIGLMANAGIKGGEAGTALRSMLTRLVKPPKEAAEALDDLGISAKNSDGTMKPLREVLGDLRSKFSGLDDSQKAQYAASIAGQEAMSGLLAIVNTSDEDFNKLTKSIDNSKDAAKKQADTMNDNLKGAIQELGSSAESVGIEIYDDIKGPLKKLTKDGARQVRGLAAAIKKNGIKSIIPKEAITTVKSLGSIAKSVGGGGIKILGKAIKILGDNFDVALPAVTGLLTAFEGYKVVKTVTSVIGTARDAVSGFKTAADVAGAMTRAENAVSGMTVAVGALSGGMGKATAASGILEAGVTALGGPIGAAVIAIGAMAAGVGIYALSQETLSKKLKRSAEAQEKYLESIKENKKAREESIEAARTEGKQASFLSMKLEDLMSVENKSAGQKEQIKSIVEKLNELLPDLGLAYDEEKDKLNKSTDAIKKNITAQKELAMAKAYGAQTEGIIEDIVKTEDKLAKAEEKRVKATKDLAEANKAVEKARNDKSVAPKDNIDLQIALEEQRQLNEVYDSANEQVIKYQQSLAGLNTELETAENRQVGGENYAEFLSSIDKICEEARIEATDIPKSVHQGIKEGFYANPMTGEELNALINLDGPMNGLIQEAHEKGEEVPAAVAQGIQNGKYVLPASVDQMEALIKLDEVQKMSLESGVKIPNNLSKGIASGKSKPSSAIKQMEALVTFDQLVTESGMAGIEAVQKLVAAVNSGETKPAEAVKQMNALVEKESAQGLGEAADKGGEEYSKGLESKKGAITKSGKEASTAAKKGAKGESFKPVGAFVGSGIATGLISKIPEIQAAARRAVKAAKDSAKDEGEIHSPSRVFRDEVGKFLPLGMAVGIEKYTGAVETASRGMAQASIDATTDELDIHSPSKKFKEIVGKNIPKGIAAGVKVAKNELIAEMKSTMSEVLFAAQGMVREGKYSQVGSNLMSGLSESLNTAKTRSSNNLQASIDKQYEALTAAHEKAEKAKQDEIDKAKGKKNKKKRNKLKKQLSKLKAANKKEAAQLQEAGEKAANAFNTAFEKESDRLTQIAQKNIQELSEEYQKEYDRIAGLRDNLINKQQSWGNVYDLKQNLYDIERYQKHLKALENKIPESMMEKILGMNVDEASAYMEWFQAMSADQQKAYIANWNKQQSMSETFSNDFFAADFAKIESEYQTKLKKATDDLQKQIKQAGVNIAKGLAAGIASETRSASKAIKDLCNKLIKTAKKQLKIKSPSRKFAEIGRYDVLGLEKGHEKEAKNLYRQMEDVSETMAQKFARARLNIPELQGRMQSAVQKQMGRITANVQMPKVSQNTAPDVKTERIVYIGPEKIEVTSVLDGREVARSTVPFMDQFLNDVMNRRLRGGV